MVDTRLKRLARRLVSDLEDLYIHPTEDIPDYEKHYGPSFERIQKEMKVVGSEKTKQKLEKWFKQRKIPVRIIYTTVDRMNELNKPSITPIGKKGVITYVYTPVGQELPTAWMLAHNLGHALFDERNYYEGKSPYEGLLKIEEEEDDPEVWEEKYNLMGRDTNRPALYPTTRSQQLGKIDAALEGFYELFAQWVVKGQVILNPRNPELEKKLADRFRYYVDKAASLGAVVYND